MPRTLEQLISRVAALDAKLTTIVERVRRIDSLSEDVAGLRRDMLHLLGNGRGGALGELRARIAGQQLRTAADFRRLHQRVDKLQLETFAETAANRVRWKAALLYGGVSCGILDALLHLGQLMHLLRY